LILRSCKFILQLPDGAIEGAQQTSVGVTATSVIQVLNSSLKIVWFKFTPPQGTSG